MSVMPRPLRNPPDEVDDRDYKQDDNHHRNHEAEQVAYGVLSWPHPDGPAEFEVARSKERQPNGHQHGPGAASRRSNRGEGVSWQHGTIHR
jgi:hypothetical protein